MLAGAFLVYASANSPVPIAAELRDGVGLSGDDAALFMLPFAAGFAVGCLLWFGVARHRSPTMLLPMALVLIAAGTLLLVLAATPAAAGTGRFAVGLASAAFPAAAQAVISHGAPLRLRGRLIGGFAAAVVAGGLVGQAIVGVLADLSSARTALVAVCMVAPLITAVALRAAVADAPGAPTARAPRAVRTLMRRQWPALATAALLFGTYWLMLTQLAATVRADRFGLTASEAGLLPVLGLAGIATTLGGGWLSDRAGHRVPVIATIALGIVALAVTIPAGAPVWLFAAGFGLFIAAYWGFLAPGASEVAFRAGDERQPAMMAFYAAAWVGAVTFTALGTLAPGWTTAALVTVGAWAASGVIAIATFHGAPLHPRGAGGPAPEAPGGGGSAPGPPPG